MTEHTRPQGGDVFIVDNSDSDWKVRRYLHDWAEISTSFDVATGCFEIGSLLALDGQWQKLEKIRLLMGSETTRRTRQALLEALKTGVKSQLDFSIEKAKRELGYQPRTSFDDAMYETMAYYKKQAQEAAAPAGP